MSASARKVIFDKKNVLVVGGAGFIGSHLCDELVKENKVICIDDYSSGGVENISHLLQHPNFIFLRHDITEPLDLENFPELEVFQVAFQGIQEVYYLAAPTIQVGFEDLAIATAKANSVGVINGLDIARRYEARFLFGSTRAVYGDPLQGQEVFEESYWGFVNNMDDRACYNEGKRFGETVTHTYHKAYGMDTKIARIFNTYGPRMRLNSGRMIPDFVRSAINNESVVVHGDGTHQDSYCYIDDMVQGLVALMRSNVNEPVNLGNPDTHRIIDVANMVIQLADSKSSVVFDDAITGLVRFAQPDIAKAKRYLGWFPVVGMETGLQRTVADMLGSQVLSYQSLQEKSAQEGVAPTPPTVG